MQGAAGEVRSGDQPDGARVGQSHLLPALRAAAAGGPRGAGQVPQIHAGAHKPAHTGAGRHMGGGAGRGAGRQAGASCRGSSPALLSPSRAALTLTSVYPPPPPPPPPSSSSFLPLPPHSTDRENRAPGADVAGAPPRRAALWPRALLRQAAGKRQGGVLHAFGAFCCNKGAGVPTSTLGSNRTWCVLLRVCQLSTLADLSPPPPAHVRRGGCWRQRSAAGWQRRTCARLCSTSSRCRWWRREWRRTRRALEAACTGQLGRERLSVGCELPPTAEA